MAAFKLRNKMILLLMFGSLYYTYHSFSRATVDIIEINSGLKYINYADLAKQICAFSGGLFFANNLEEIQEKLIKNLSLIDSLKIMRKWPYRFRVVIKESRPIAQLVGGGYVDYDGNLIDSAENLRLNNLPLLQCESKNIEEAIIFYKKILEVLSGTGMEIKKLQINRYDSIEVVLANNWNLILSKGAFNSQLDKFLGASMQLLQYGTKINYADLRYTQGFAVGWNDALYNSMRNKSL